MKKTKEEILSDVLKETTTDDVNHWLISPRQTLKAMSLYAAQAIAEHGQKQWKKYPEEKPEGKTKYIVQYYDNSIDVLLYFGGKFTSYDNHVIAFRELPSPYQPTEKGEQNP